MQEKLSNKISAAVERRKIHAGQFASVKAVKMWDQ